MKVLLVNPARTYYKGSKGVRLGLPLGLMYIASVLEKNHIQVKIFDTLISPATKIIERLDHIYHGVDDDFFKEVIVREKPDVAGITSPFTAQIRNSCEAARLIKEVDSNIFVVSGGPHFAVLGKEFLKENKNIDVAMIGEGELVMPKLLEAIEDKQPFNAIDGLIYRFINDSGESTVIANAPKFIGNLDSLPIPAYHLIDMERYFDFLKDGLYARPGQRKRSISMITSRGCPFDCVFCSIHLHMGRAWRAHSADYVIFHIEQVVNKYGVEHISFEDDNFTLNSKRCEYVFDRLLEKKLNVTWDTPNGVRADTLNRELLEKMKKSGCIELVVGTESGDQDTLDNIIKKQLRLEKVVQVARWCKELGIKLNSFFVIGFPGETKKKIQKTIDFAFLLYKKFNVRPNLMTATPLLGTELHKIAVDNGYLMEELTAENLALATQPRGKPLIKTPEFSPQDLKEFDNQLKTRLARLNLVRRLVKPREWFRLLKLFLAKPSILIVYIKKLKGQKER